jgi:hypothetical protein
MLHLRYLSVHLRLDGHLDQVPSATILGQARWVERPYTGSGAAQPFPLKA